MGKLSSYKYMHQTSLAESCLQEFVSWSKILVPKSLIAYFEGPFRDPHMSELLVSMAINKIHPGSHKGNLPEWYFFSSSVVTQPMESTPTSSAPSHMSASRWRKKRPETRWMGGGSDLS